MKSIHLFSFVAFLLLLNGCDTTDLTAPTVQLVANGTLAPLEAEALAGSSLVLTFELVDDTDLGSMRIDIHDASGHSHDGTDADWILFSGAEDWAELDLVNLTGTSRLMNRTYNIPGHIRGVWDLVVDVTDAAGNQAETQYMQVHVENDSIPLFEVAYTSEPVWQSGMSAELSGTVSDADGLASATAALHNASGVLVQEVNIPLVAGDFSADLSGVSFDVPVGAAGEEWEVELEATDLLGYTCRTSFHVEITE